MGRTRAAAAAPTAAGTPGPRELYNRAVRGDGAIPAAGAAARRGSERLGMGQSLGGPHWRSGPASAAFGGASRAQRKKLRELLGGSSLKLARKFSSGGVRSAVRACACFPPSRAPSRFLKALPVGSLRLRTGLGKMPSGSPLPCPSPSPPPSGPLGLVSYSSFPRGRGGGGGGESNRSC